MDTSPQVTILMLTYNRGKYIREAIESVLNQTFNNWQLVILDDGSTDNTKEIVESFTDPRVTYIQNKENKGLYAMRQESLPYATTKYTAVLDSDDVWISPEKLEKQVEYLNQHPDCVIVGTFTKKIDQHGNSLGSVAYRTTDKDIRGIILIQNQFTHSSVMMRTNAIKKTAGYREVAPAEDVEFFLQLGLHGTFANLPEYMTAYRIHTGSASQRKMVMVQGLFKTIKMHRAHYPHFLLAYLVNCIRAVRTLL